ncbi:MAG: gfo/Idh/MocA family oxidoreductase [Candidatus Omnitrophota bacterium]|jgi:predicted dehydrogenase|nr:MAG: gfo/Idh/MocA family oxidoreductase [Candidatus Omnitrophota bacterium]
MHRRTFLMGLSALSATAMQASVTNAASERKIRIGVVGGGFGCSFYWHEHPHCIVAAVSDLRPDRRDRLVKTFHCETVYESLEKLILDKNIDAVAVFTGAPDHVRHCAAVMKSGKHVISAVPAACSLEECQTLIETKQKTGMTYMMAETSYYRQEAITARQWFKEGKFGNLFYIETEYHHDMTHDGPTLRYYQGKPTWRYGFPPMHYPTHALGFVTGVTGERMTNVMCVGQYNKESIELQDNVYNNPFCNSTAFYKTDRGNCVRHSEFRHVAAGICERAQWYGDQMSFFMPTPNGAPAVTCAIGERPQPYDQPNHWQTDMLPETMRHSSGHGGSHTFLTHEFISALIENRKPAVDVYEAVAYTAPGLVAHQSALKGGEQMPVPDFGTGE